MLEKLKEEVYKANMDLPKYGLVTRKSYGDGKRSLLLRPEKQRNMEINSKALLS